MSNPRPIILSLFQSKDIFKLQTLNTGVYEQPILAQGNSLLSSVYYKSGTGSIKVEWFDSTIGTSYGEEYQLNSHPIINSPTTHRITVSSLHDKPVCRVTITGGPVEFGVYVTVINSFSSDLDAAMQYHDAAVDLIKNKGLPQVLWDTDDNKWKLATGKNGAQNVNVESINISSIEVNKTIVGQTSSAVPSITNNTLSYTVPSGKRFIWISGLGTADCDCLFTVEIDSIEVMKKRNSHIQPNCTLSPSQFGMTLNAGQTLTVKTKNRSIWGTLSLIDVFIYGNEQNA